MDTMSTTQDIEQAARDWREHTSALRQDLMAKELAKAEKAIRKEREGKVQPVNVFNKTQQQKAANVARGAVISALYKLKEHDGMSNPLASDPIWGHDSEAAAEAKKAAAPTPNKYAGKCADCGGWVEANAGTITKRNGRWASLHVGGCPEAKAAPLRKNSYPGTCVDCGQSVPAEQGHITKGDSGWLTHHNPGTCPEATEAAQAAKDGLDLSGLVPGYYAVPGGSRLKLAINHGKQGGKWEGYTFVKDGAEYGAQERYGMQRPGQAYRGKVAEELALVLADPKAAMKAYGKLVGRCGACGRQLEDEASVAAGIGPICAEKWEG